MKLEFFKISALNVFSYPVEIRRSSIKLNDNLFSLGWDQDDGTPSFELFRRPFQPSYSPESKTSTHIDFYLDMDLYDYTRSTYTLLDYLRDIGGLFGAFNAISGGLVFVLNFNGLY